MQEVEKVNRCLAGIECSRIEIWKKVGIFFLLFLNFECIQCTNIIVFYFWAIYEVCRLVVIYWIFSVSTAG